MSESAPHVDPAASPDPVAELEAIQAGNIAGPAKLGQPEAGHVDAPQAEAPISGEVLVDWDDGVQRKVQVSDLVKAARSGEDLATREQALEAMFTKNVAVKSLVERLEGMSDAQRNLVMQALQNPDSLMPQQRQQTPETDDEVMSEIMEHPNTPQPPKPQFEDRFSRVEQAVAGLSQHVLGQMQKQQTETLGDRVSKEMAGFPVFQEAPEAASFAQEAVMLQLAQNPEADVSRLVADHAAKTHRLVSSIRSGPAPAAPTASARPHPNLTRKQEATGDDLNSGQLLNELRGIFGS